MAKINILEKGAQFINELLEKLKIIKTKPEWDDLAQEAMRNQSFKIDPFLTKLHAIEKASTGRTQDMQRTRAQQPQQPQRPMQPSYSAQPAYAGGYTMNQQAHYQSQQGYQYKDTERSLKDLLDAARQRRMN